MKSKYRVFLMGAVFALTGCSSSDNFMGSAAEFSLQGTAWELRSYTAANGDSADVAEATKYQLFFDPQSLAMDVFIGCVNFVGSAYALNDGYLTLALGARDAVVCINQAEQYIAQDSAIMSLLQGSGNVDMPLMYSVTDNQMVLTSPDGRSLLFEAVNEILQQASNDAVQSVADTSWVVNAYRDRDKTPHTIPTDAQWALSFHHDESRGQSVAALGFGPCNSITFSYSSNGSTLTRSSEMLTPEGGCDAVAPIELPLLFQSVYRMIGDSAFFTIIRGGANTITLIAETGEVLESAN